MSSPPLPLRHILSKLKSLTVEDMLKCPGYVWSRSEIRSVAVLSRWDEVDRLADQGKLHLIDTWVTQGTVIDSSIWIRPHLMDPIQTLEELDAISSTQLSPQERKAIKERLWTTLPIDQLLQRPKISVSNLIKRREITPEIVELFNRDHVNGRRYDRINLALVPLCPTYIWNRWFLSQHPGLTFEIMCIVDTLPYVDNPWHIDQVSSRIPLTVKLVLSELFRVGYTWSRWGLSCNPTITTELMMIFDTEFDPKVITDRWNWSALTQYVPVDDLIDNLDRFVHPHDLPDNNWKIPGWRSDGLSQRSQDDVDRFCDAYRELYPHKFEALVYHREFRTQISVAHLLRYRKNHIPPLWPQELIQHHRTLTISDLYYLCDDQQRSDFGLDRPASIPNLATKPWLDLDIVASSRPNE
jgi:hypothetical protein